MVQGCRGWLETGAADLKLYTIGVNIQEGGRSYEAYVKAFFSVPNRVGWRFHPPASGRACGYLESNCIVLISCTNHKE